MSLESRLCGGLHRCSRCKSDYLCQDLDWVCPTLNGDENGNLCSPCEDVEAAELQAHMELHRRRYAE